MKRFALSRRRLLQQLGISAAALSSGFAPHILADNNQRKLGVALVGLGRYSTNQLAPALQLTQHCELRGIVTGSPEKIPVWQERYGIKDANVYNYENMHTVADNPDIDIIYVVTPTGVHKKYSVIGANAGKHVWCEKPMAMDEKECQDIIDACRKNKVKLTIGYRMQHEPNTQTVMEFARTRPYGAIERIRTEAAYAGGENRPADNWRMQAHMGGGAMYDMGVYPLNAARYATGEEPIAITAHHEITHPEAFTEVDSTTHFTLEFPSGAIAEGMTSFVKPGNKLEVHCEDGWYRLQPMSSYTGVQGETSDGRQLNKPIANQQAAQMDNDSLAILRDTEVIVPGEEGLRDVRLVQAAFESARKEKRITL
ncbi:Gfo/Idh/MocA family protein [Marinimicrobium sp. ABcell2]|uniref:Gfo/Idh/MocA family protein n=1 Tax=Marinimicrobium sp. ABcell2 TaxID=3069751 RepID=UPI0027B3B868|nr:Gfo/Idh/MocA family oxidoreductase [Marinimicrobium sp. ABcell2]MDQ2077096.1 Gfo/Idh/MocA family oxidoreductase [Marinimicrobium sp. ABcell2]